MNIRIENLNSIFLDFSKDSNIRINETIVYIDNFYNNKEVLGNCLAFINHLTSAISTKSKFGGIGTIISSLDSKIELLNSLNLASIGVYKSSFDSLRRALEITLVGFYFDLLKGDKIEYEDEEIKNDIIDWYKSKISTPFFNSITNKLTKKGNFKIVNDRLNWITSTQELFYKLSDISHTQGIEKSIVKLNKRKRIYYTPEFNEESLNLVLNYFIETTKAIATAYAIHNPILIYGLSVAEKFGFNKGGLFEEYQSQILLKIVPENYKTIIMEIVKTDSEIQERIKKIEDMPVSKDFLQSKNLFNL